MLFLIAPSGPPQNLQVFNATTTSLTAKWDHAPGRVQNYRITYVPVAGGRSQSVKNILTFFMFILYDRLMTLLQVMCSISISTTKQITDVSQTQKLIYIQFIQH